jgi:hypothetical protein
MTAVENKEAIEKIWESGNIVENSRKPTMK